MKESFLIYSTNHPIHLASLMLANLFCLAVPPIMMSYDIHVLVFLRPCSKFS
jgi:hypothetical protein